MPIHDYECSKCEQEFEEITLKFDEYPKRCPNCNAPKSKLKRLMSRNGTHVSWSQWNAANNNR